VFSSDMKNWRCARSRSITNWLGWRVKEAKLWEMLELLIREWNEFLRVSWETSTKMVEHKMKKEYQSISQRVHQTICGMIISHIRAAQEEGMN
jgi:predicted molibdopterin-dependent oxidoreductase YjgC